CTAPWPTFPSFGRLCRASSSTGACRLSVVLRVSINSSRATKLAPLSPADLNLGKAVLVVVIGSSSCRPLDIGDSREHSKNIRERLNLCARVTYHPVNGPRSLGSRTSRIKFCYSPASELTTLAHCRLGTGGGGKRPILGLCGRLVAQAAVCARYLWLK